MTHLKETDKNGWIPAETPPGDAQEVWVVLEHTYPSDYLEYGVARYICVEGECHWCAAHYGYLGWEKYSDGHGGSSLYRVAAWQPVRPYGRKR